ncbi:terminase small subunit-like protein [Asaia krungthepensis]|nr:terminase small subunit [Asaia krungthepensis]
MAKRPGKVAGRPSSYSAAIADEICDRIMDGESLRQICRDPGMPGQRTVFEWLEAPTNEDFRSKYARARARAAEAFEDEIIDAARGATPEDAAARKVHITTMQWVMSKRAPKVYGEKVTQELTGVDGAPLQMPTLVIAPFQSRDEPDEN